ncbi:hypothetical protein K437DRAFT_71999 [Tilletiaria anomala UBC 951]|uniref:Uncharacterized protein n=1 Tax=Tilletiaria anomala (strain ATCC 24038 / CBS 436.72 / UBC 951) TaxID=1037660 RepID=A0A066WR31_TILAU|nr:uncharacterized protein K437DRAFT_71999 [Tilletiaria anomala UBC 951]KDN53454.1 hypothetical protein K437DRAFT_71999 [Tilletiaria anomala UBC 951]
METAHDGRPQRLDIPTAASPSSKASQAAARSEDSRQVGLSPLPNYGSLMAGKLLPSTALRSACACSKEPCNEVNSQALQAAITRFPAQPIELLPRPSAAGAQASQTSQTRTLSDKSEPSRASSEANVRLRCRSLALGASHLFGLGLIPY